jgi:hypothetical protein
MFGLLGQAAGNQLSQNQMWTLIGLGAVTIIYIAVLKPMMRRKDPLDRPSGFSTLSQHRSVERQMQTLLVDLSEMARQITAQLDTRSTKLELLIKEADEKIAQLEAATTSSTPPVRSPDLPNSSPLVEELDPRHSEVYALADQGRDAYEIAAQLGRPRGEVELILALRSK